MPDHGTGRMPPERTRGGRAITGRHVLAGMLAFYAVIIGANLAMAFSAGRSWTGLLTDNVYIESQRYGETIAANRAARESGIEVTVSQREGRLAVTLAGTGLGARVEGARAERPVGEHEDRDLALARVAGSTFVSAEPLPRGAWNLTLPVTDGGETHVLRRRVVVQGTPQ